MVFRRFTCSKCKKSWEITLESMLTDIPKDIDCIDENCDGKANYDISELAESMTIIPPHMRAGGHSSMKYNTLSREKRKYK